MANVAFFGLGNMGLPMAANLAKAGHRVAGFDPVAESRTRGVALAVEDRGDAAATVEGADFVFSMLPGDAQMLSLHTGDGGLLSLAPREAVFVDCSTTSVHASKAFHAAAAQLGIAALDAPVSGGITGARGATLSFIVGGDAGALERARPLLGQMGANIFHAGGPGNGQLAKICNNMLLSVQMIATGEAYGLAQANGLAPETLAAIMRESSGTNWCLQKYNPYPGIMENVPSSKGYQGGFLTDLMVKDSDLAMEAARNSGAYTPLGALANQIFRHHQQGGNGRLDFGSVIRGFVETG